MYSLINCIFIFKSLRSPERGLKYNPCHILLSLTQVAPFAGAWIEILISFPLQCSYWSLRSPERGLKCLLQQMHIQRGQVAPFAGAWIEIIIELSLSVVLLIVAPFAGAWIEIAVNKRCYRSDNVAPFAGAWIEIPSGLNVGLVLLVAPFAGAWIEISVACLFCMHQLQSLRSPERGLKLIVDTSSQCVHVVAPFAGAWIEILPSSHLQLIYYVAPFAGAWIEIHLCSLCLFSFSVAPFAGAWIEIPCIYGAIFEPRSLRSPERGLKYSPRTLHHCLLCRSVRRSVD